jgi:hypothetical protein
MSPRRHVLASVLSNYFTRARLEMSSRCRRLTANNTFLIILTIICILAVFFNYQVSISPLGGFRFEPAEQADLSQPPLPSFTSLDQENENFERGFRRLKGS